MSKIYTPQDIDQFPIINGTKSYRSGNYKKISHFHKTGRFEGYSTFGPDTTFSAYSEFGPGCVFGKGCIFAADCFFHASETFREGCIFHPWCTFSYLTKFGKKCQFMEQCIFGDDTTFGGECYFERNYTAKPGYPIITLSGCGSSNRLVRAFNVQGGPIIRAGCFVGTLDRFRDKVRLDRNKLKSLQYLGWANIVAATWCPDKIERISFP